MLNTLALLSRQPPTALKRMGTVRRRGGGDQGRSQQKVQTDSFRTRPASRSGLPKADFFSSERISTVIKITNNALTVSSAWFTLVIRSMFRDPALIIPH